MKAKTWLLIWLAGVIAVFGIIGSRVYAVDPFFHYHAPDTEKYYYPLNNQRAQNDGIIKHFTYDAMIIGTSMTENFRSSEMDDLFGCNSIKVNSSGASFREIDENIALALNVNPELKTVVRCLELKNFLMASDYMRTDLGVYPTYLYDSNPFNDVQYLFNRDIVFGRVYEMMRETNKEGFTPGITTFDNYSRWPDSFPYGIGAVCPEEIKQKKETKENHLTEEEKAVISKSVTENVLQTADANPGVEFYYFYSPYSIAWWNEAYNNGTLIKQLEAERYITELILPHENIRLFSFNNRFDITTDLNNYKDAKHYGYWINSLILKWMRDGEGLLTEENYREYLEKEADFYLNFDYESLNGQEDYETVFYAGALLNRELTGAEPTEVLDSSEYDLILSGSEYLGEDGKITGIRCVGRLERASDGEDRVIYLRDREYIGAKFTVDLDRGYNYLSFYGQKIRDHGQPDVYAYDEDGTPVAWLSRNYSEIDSEKHHFVMDLSGIKGKVTIIMNGGYIDNTGSADSEFWFSDIRLY